MIRIDARRFALRRGALIASAAALFGVGCTGQLYAGPVAPPPPAPVYVEGAPQPYGDESVVDVEYAPEPPVDDIETYPVVVYEGVPVYYVGGTWYRHDSRGWGYYRREPRELARQRETHDRDAQWVQARERRPPPPPRQGATERQPPDRGAPPPQQGTVQPQPPNRPAPPAKAAPSRKLEEPTPPSPKRVKPLVRHPAPAQPPPSAPAPREPEHR